MIFGPKSHKFQWYQSLLGNSSSNKCKTYSIPESFRETSKISHVQQDLHSGSVLALLNEPLSKQLKNNEYIHHPCK